MTFMPALASLLLPKRIEETEPFLLRVVKFFYIPVLKLTMKFKLAVLLFGAAVLVVAFGLIAPQLGAEFMPKLSEGAIALNIIRLPGTTMEESIAPIPQWKKRF